MTTSSGASAPSRSTWSSSFRSTASSPPRPSCRCRTGLPAAHERRADECRDRPPRGAAHVGRQRQRRTYPHLFGAIVGQVPLLDMRRYHELLAGASWMAEYGDPDQPSDWVFLREYSPYHNVRSGHSYPPVMFLTSTRDDRVHPAHARKMVARMREYGYDVAYYENIEGGHGGAADNAQLAFKWTLILEFLWRKVGSAA